MEELSMELYVLLNETGYVEKAVVVLISNFELSFETSMVSGIYKLLHVKFRHMWIASAHFNKQRYFLELFALH
jgi:hypothetical protein